MRLIRRTKYLDTLIDVLGTPDIKVITGIRRSGKSKLLEALCDHVRECEPSANVIYINYNDVEFESLLEYHELLDYVERRYRQECVNLLCIDEVQMCSGFERAINSLHASERYDIYITGSNAFLLSSDLSTLFTGRSFEMEVFPFSFGEFCTYYGRTDLDAAFDDYVIQGGMAGSYVYKQPEQRSRYVADVFRTLVVRDIRQRHRIRNVDMLDRVADFMMDNTSNITSASNIASALSAHGTKADTKTIRSYMRYLVDAFSFYQIRRFDIRGKKYLASGEKFYLADHAFRYAILGTRNMDWGRTYENIVAIELLRRGYEVYVGVLYKNEIDFVAVRQSEKVYIQVSDDISSDSTFKRECDPLLKIRDAYPKMLIARTRHDSYSYEGIRIVDIVAWLSEPGHMD